jgi:hypothetical protein
MDALAKILARLIDFIWQSVLSVGCRVERLMRSRKSRRASKQDLEKPGASDARKET